MYKIIKCVTPVGTIYIIQNSKTGVLPTDRFYVSLEEAEIAKGHLGPPEWLLRRLMPLSGNFIDTLLVNA